MKKKLSVALALTMVMMLSAAAALAVMTLRETGRLFAQTEQELGDYIDWPADNKAAVVLALIDAGYLSETTERTQLREGMLSPEETARVADEAVAEFTGEAAQYASFLSVMSAAWGPFEAWPQEQKAWYSQVMAEVGALEEGETIYVEAAGTLTAQEAVAIAKQEIARGFGMDESLLEQYRIYEVSLQIPEFARDGDTKAYWYIALDTMQTALEGQNGLPFQAIDVFVDPETGALLEPIEEKAASLTASTEAENHPLAVAIREFEAAIQEPKAFHTWTPEHKARWSAEIAPQIRAYVEANGEDATLALNDEIQLSIAFTYGLPDENALPQAQAMTIAREALAAACGLSDEELSLLMDNGLAFDQPALFYDVTEPARPQWKLLFTMPTIYCSDDAIAARVKALYGQDMTHDQFYLVELDAYTGAVLRTLATRTLPEMLAGMMP